MQAVHWTPQSIDQSRDFVRNRRFFFVVGLFGSDGKSMVSTLADHQNDSGRWCTRTLSANTFVKNGLSQRRQCSWTVLQGTEYMNGQRAVVNGEKKSATCDWRARRARWTDDQRPMGILELNSRSKWRAHLNISSLKMAETRKSVHGDPSSKVKFECNLFYLSEWTWLLRVS